MEKKTKYGAGKETQKTLKLPGAEGGRPRAAARRVPLLRAPSNRFPPNRGAATSFWPRSRGAQPALGVPGRSGAAARAGSRAGGAGSGAELRDPRRRHGGDGGAREGAGREGGGGRRLCGGLCRRGSRARRPAVRAGFGPSLPATEKQIAPGNLSALGFDCISVGFPDL